MGFLFNVDPFVRFFHSDLWSFIVRFETVSISLSFKDLSSPFPSACPPHLLWIFHPVSPVDSGCWQATQGSVANAGAHTYTLTTGAEADLHPSFSSHFTIGLSGPPLHLFSPTSFSFNMFHMGFGTDTWFSISIHQPKYVNSFCCP